MAELPAIVRAFANVIHATLGERLVAVYLGGSYAMGDFVHASSDYDLMVVVDRPLSDLDVQRLRSAHDSIAHRAEFERLEGDYAPRQWIVPSGTTAPVDWFHAGRIKPRREFMLSADNVANMREHSIAVFGPPAADVLPSVSENDVRAAVREMLADRDPVESETQAAEEIVSLLRSIRALETGAPTTKSDGVRWGLKHLPADRQAIVRDADAIRRGAKADETRSTLREALADLRRKLI